MSNVTQFLLHYRVLCILATAASYLCKLDVELAPWTLGVRSEQKFSVTVELDRFPLLDLILWKFLFQCCWSPKRRGVPPRAPKIGPTGDVLILCLGLVILWLTANQWVLQIKCSFQISDPHWSLAQGYKIQWLATNLSVHVVYIERTQVFELTWILDESSWESPSVRAPQLRWAKKKARGCHRRDWALSLHFFISLCIVLNEVLTGISA